jgi:hypothetical protein
LRDRVERLHGAAQQALEVLENVADEVFSPYNDPIGDAILDLRAALEQPEWQGRDCPLYQARKRDMQERPQRNAAAFLAAIWRRMR